MSDATYSVNTKATINTGNFNNVTVTVGASLPLEDGADLEESITALADRLDAIIVARAKAIVDEMVEVTKAK